LSRSQSIASLAIDNTNTDVSVISHCANIVSLMELVVDPRCLSQSSIKEMEKCANLHRLIIDGDGWVEEEVIRALQKSQKVKEVIIRACVSRDAIVRASAGRQRVTFRVDSDCD
jgi:hypothetical protein